LSVRVSFPSVRDKDGSVGHLVDMILLGPDGTEMREYDGEIVKPKEIVDDVRKALSEVETNNETRRRDG
jgi:hypothetical protein